MMLFDIRTPLYYIGTPADINIAIIIIIILKYYTLYVFDSRWFIRKQVYMVYTVDVHLL